MSEDEDDVETLDEDDVVEDSEPFFSYDDDVTIVVIELSYCSKLFSVVMSASLWIYSIP